MIVTHTAQFQGALVISQNNVPTRGERGISQLPKTVSLLVVQSSKKQLYLGTAVGTSKSHGFTVQIAPRFVCRSRVVVTHTSQIQGSADPILGRILLPHLHILGPPPPPPPGWSILGLTFFRDFHFHLRQIFQLLVVKSLASIVFCLSWRHAQNPRICK